MISTDALDKTICNISDKQFTTLVFERCLKFTMHRRYWRKHSSENINEYEPDIRTV